MITGPIATIIAAGIAATVAIFGSIAMIYHRLGKLEQAMEANKEMVQSESGRLSDKMDVGYTRLSDRMDAGYTRLSDRMDADNARLSDRMDAGYTRLSDRMDADSSLLSDKIDSLRAETRAEINHLSEKMDAQHAETMEEIRRLVDTLISHSHDADGNIVFRIPPWGTANRYPRSGEDPQVSGDPEQSA